MSTLKKKCLEVRGPWNLHGDVQRARHPWRQPERRRWSILKQESRILAALCRAPQQAASHFISMNFSFRCSTQGKKTKRDWQWCLKMFWIFPLFGGQEAILWWWVRTQEGLDITAFVSWASRSQWHEKSRRSSHTRLSTAITHPLFNALNHSSCLKTQLRRYLEQSAKGPGANNGTRL